MINLKRLGASVLAAGVLTAGAIVPASAVTVYHSNSYYGPSDGVTQVKYCWHDYNWWEETFQWKRDGYKPCGIRRV